MNTSNNNNPTSSKIRKLHNPKANAPAVYIPCWLIQIPVSLLSHGAKLVYGRLSQWCSESGNAFRSAKQLAQELGMCESSVEKYQRELRGVELIGTFQTQAGGLNHFEFYDHPWMYDPINENLVYKQDSYVPPPNVDIPPVRSYGTPPYDHTDINIKEIIINNTSKTFVDSDKSTTEIKEYQDDELFMAFYIQYPNKQKPTAAYKAFKKLNPDEKFVTMLILDLMSRKANNWKGRHKSKIPHPATYLNGKEWEGEIYSQETNTQISNKPPRYTVSELYSTVKFTDEIL